MDLSGSELLIVLVVVVVLFGSSRLPKLARSLGEAQREFRRGVHHAHDDDPPEPTKPAEPTRPAAAAAPPATTSADAPTVSTAPVPAAAPTPAIEAVGTPPNGNGTS